MEGQPRIPWGASGGGGVSPFLVDQARSRRFVAGLEKSVALASSGGWGLKV